MITTPADVSFNDQLMRPKGPEASGAVLRDIESLSEYITKIKSATETALYIKEGRIARTKLLFDKKMVQLSKKSKNLKHAFSV